jgi:hypothetical protein
MNRRPPLALMALLAGAAALAGAGAAQSVPSAPLLCVLSLEETDQLFGPLPWTPVPGDASAIQIAPAWFAAHIVAVDVPQLVHVPGANGGRVLFHKAVAPRVLRMFAAIEQAGKLDRILTWHGSFAARRTRGGTTVSKHAYGVAFDLNAQANPQGSAGAPLGMPGSLVEIEPFAAAEGFVSGRRFRRTPDPMHFEAAR